MNTTQTAIKINGPADLVATIPLLLGFHPEHSLVAVGLKDAALECTFRVDLPGSIDHLEHLVDLTGQLSLNECERCVLVAYGEAEIAEASLERAAQRLDDAGIKTIDRIRITGGRWVSLTCDRDCCPAEGLPVPEHTAASCEVAVAGHSALPDRAAVAAQLHEADPGPRAAVAAAVAAALAAEAELDWAEQRSRDLHAVDHWMASARLPGPDDIAAVGLALGDTDIRDYTLRRVNSGEFDTGRTDLWIWLARHLEADLAAPAATVAGYAAYRLGNGVLALEALDAALRAQPNYRLAQMLMAALQAGIPPSALSRIGSGGAGEALDG